MVSRFWRLGWTALATTLVGVMGTAAVADSVVPIHLNPVLVNNNNFGRFSYDSTVTPSSTLGPYGAFEFDSGEGGGGSGVGINFAVNNNSPFDPTTGLPVVNVTPAHFPYLDRAAFGANFNPDDYRIEVVYRPLANNAATTFSVMLDRHKGFFPDPNDGGRYKRMAEQIQWGFFDIIDYHAANQGADGFATISLDVNAPDPENPGQVIATHQFGGVSWMFEGGDGFHHEQLTRPEPEVVADLDAFSGMIPNGAGQIHMQSSYNENFPERLHIEVRDIRFVPRSPDPTLLARFDSRSGISNRFGTPFQTNQLVQFNDGDGFLSFVEVTDQLQRFDENGFTNVIINTSNDSQLGGFGTWQNPIYQAFDGTEATLHVTARLTAPLDGTRAEVIDIVLNDLDGNDAAPSEGADEYKYYIDLNQFNETSMTTISIPLTDYDELQTAPNFTNSGNGSLSDFNLFFLGFLTREGEGLVNLEIESVEIRLPAGPSADLDGDGIVDGHDLLLWQRGAADPAVLAAWESQFGTTVNSEASLAQIPEPTSLGLLLLGTLGLGIRRGRRCVG